MQPQDAVNKGQQHHTSQPPSWRLLDAQECPVYDLYEAGVNSPAACGAIIGYVPA